MSTRAWVAVAVALTGAGDAVAQDQQQDHDRAAVLLHGFVSQGYLNSSEHRLLDTDTDEGAFSFNEAALAATVEPVARLRVALQVFARDLGPQGNHDVTVDWAVGDYRWRDWLGFRAGRVKQPLGLYNVLSDADVARPEVLQPGSVYPLFARDLTSAFDGADVYGTLPLGRGGGLEYEAWVGTADLDDAYIVRRFSRDGSAAALPALAALRISGLDYSLGDVRADMKYLVGGALEWRPPVSGLRLRASGFKADSDFLARTTYTGFLGSAPVALATTASTRLEHLYLLFLSAEYRRGGLRLSAEHLSQHSRNTTRVSGVPGPPAAATVRDERSLAYYGQAAYRFGEPFEASAYYSVQYGDRNDREGLRFTRRGQPAHRAWAKDLAIAARVDITRHWLAKLEFHRIDGTASLSPVENPNGLFQDWSLFAFKTTFHF